MASGETRERSFGRRYARMLVWSLLGCAALAAVMLSVNAEERDHLLGRSHATAIEVLTSTPGERCHDGRHYEVRFRVVTTGEVRTTTTACQAHPLPVGVDTAWITDSGRVRFDSPTVERWSAVTTPFWIALVLTIGVPIMRERRQRLRG